MLLLHSLVLVWASPVPPQGPAPPTRSGSRFGDCVRVGDDVDGDGTPDLYVATGRDVELLHADGFVFSGATGDVVQAIRVRGLGDRVDRIEPCDDVDGDGLRDVLVLTPQRIDVHSAADGRPLREFCDRPSYRLGDVLVVEDTNEDGVRDVWMGCPAWRGHADRPPREAVLLVSGADGTVLRWLHEPGAEGDSSFGRGLALVGDQNGDGHDDLVVGAPGRDAAYVISGYDGAPLARVEGGGRPCSSFGWPLVGLGDVDGDDVEDWAVGSAHSGCSSWDDDDPSHVTAISGRTRERLWTLERSSLRSSFGHGLLPLPGGGLAIGFPEPHHDEGGVLVVDGRVGRPLEHWRGATLALAPAEVTGASLALLAGADGTASAVAAGGAVRFDDWLCYSGSVAVFELDGTLRWARAARELHPRAEDARRPELSPPLIRARAASASRASHGR